MAIDKYRDIIEREEPFSPLEDDLEISPEELQDLYQSIGVEQAELLIQEFKELKRSGFQGGFREFLQLKIKTAQGGDRPQEMMTEEEREREKQRLAYEKCRLFSDLASKTSMPLLYPNRLSRTFTLADFPQFLIRFSHLPIPPKIVAPLPRSRRSAHR